VNPSGIAGKLVRDRQPAVAREPPQFRQQRRSLALRQVAIEDQYAAPTRQAL
jgi:hypothetical protein